MHKTDDISVILCNCNGKTVRQLSMTDIDAFIRKIAPETHIIHADNLCEADTFKHLINGKGQSFIIGACSKLKPDRYLSHLLKGQTDISNTIKIIDLFEMVIGPHNTESITERIKQKIASQVLSLKVVEKPAEADADISFAIPHGEVNRRQFLQAFLPRLSIKPHINYLECSNALRCRLCINSCQFNAIRIIEDRLQIDENVCTGCGACIISCPYGAIHHPEYSAERLNAEMSGLLDTNIKLSPKILALVGHNCISGNRAFKEYPLKYPVNTVPLELPCLGMVSPVFLLEAFATGAQGLVVLYGGAQCCNEANSDQWLNNILFIQELLNHWNIEPKRIQAMNIADSTTQELESRLVLFSDYIKELPAINVQIDDEKFPDKSLSSIIKGIEEKQEGQFKGQIATENIPFGEITINGEECTVCGLCASHCPTKSLTLETGNNHCSNRLLFHHELCSGCGLCIDICPQQCLHLERVLQFSNLEKEPEVLFQDKIINCRICGTPIASKSMISILKSKLQVSGCTTDNLELCSNCKLTIENSYPNDRITGQFRNYGKRKIKNGAGTTI